MSAPEGFLTRWSRLKREADQAAPETAPAVGQPSEPPAEADAGDTTPPRAEQTDAPAVDVAALPPIESITAGSDIRAFLMPGVPAQLARAALRRAWTADPAIRDFVGLAENAWDFNAPDAVPGFGPLLPSEQARQLMADAMSDENSRAGSSPSPGESLHKPDVGAPKAESSSDISEEVSVPDRAETEVADQNDLHAALHKEETGDDRPKRSARRHGGALPRDCD